MDVRICLTTTHGQLPYPAVQSNIAQLPEVGLIRKLVPSNMGGGAVFVHTVLSGVCTVVVAYDIWGDFRLKLLKHGIRLAQNPMHYIEPDAKPQPQNLNF